MKLPSGKCFPFQAGGLFFLNWFMGSHCISRDWSIPHQCHSPILENEEPTTQAGTDQIVQSFWVPPACCWHPRPITSDNCVAIPPCLTPPFLVLRCLCLSPLKSGMFLGERESAVPLFPSQSLLPTLSAQGWPHSLILKNTQFISFPCLRQPKALKDNDSLSSALLSGKEFARFPGTESYRNVLLVLCGLESLEGQEATENIDMWKQLYYSMGCLSSLVGSAGGRGIIGFLQKKWQLGLKGWWEVQEQSRLGVGVTPCAKEGKHERAILDVDRSALTHRWPNWLSWFGWLGRCPLPLPPCCTIHVCSSWVCSFPNTQEINHPLSRKER